jgi:hypothetical protein
MLAAQEQGKHRAERKMLNLNTFNKLVIGEISAMAKCWTTKDDSLHGGRTRKAALVDPQPRGLRFER